MMRMADKVEGFTINYRKQLGQGAFGCIYECTHPDIQQQICVKIMYDKLSEQVQIAREFKIVEEISKENNPNLVKIYKCTKENKQIYIFMEKCQENLEQYIKRKRDQNQLLEISEILDFACQIITGYESLYSKNIIHRDLKPENVLIGYDNKLKITDFGLGKFINQEQNVVLNTTVGTPLYASPQAILTGCYTSKTDVFSFGALVFYLTFQKPIYTNVFNLQQLCEYAKNHDQKFHIPDIHNKGDLEMGYMLAELIKNTLREKEDDRTDWSILIQFVKQYYYKEDSVQMQQSNNSINQQRENSLQFSQAQNQNNIYNQNGSGDSNNQIQNHSIQNLNCALQNLQNYEQPSQSQNQTNIKEVNLLSQTEEFQPQLNYNQQQLQQQNQKIINNKQDKFQGALNSKQLTLTQEQYQIDNSKYLEHQSQAFSIDDDYEEVKASNLNFQFQLSQITKQQEANQHQISNQSNTIKNLSQFSQSNQFQNQQNYSQQQGSSVSKFPSFIKQSNQKKPDSNYIQQQPVENVGQSSNTQNNSFPIMRNEQRDTHNGNNIQQKASEQASIIKFDESKIVVPKQNLDQASIIRFDASKIVTTGQANLHQIQNSDQASIKFDNSKIVTNEQNNEDQTDVFKTIRNNGSYYPNNQNSIIKQIEPKIKPQRNYNNLEFIKEDESENIKEERVLPPPQQQYGQLKKKKEAQSTSYSIKLIVEICIEYFILAEKILKLLKTNSLINQTSSLYFIMKFVLRLYQNSIICNINSVLRQDEFMTISQIYQQISNLITHQSLIDYNQNQSNEFIQQKIKLEKITEFSNSLRKEILEEFKKFQYNRENFDIKSILGLLSQDNFLYQYKSFIEEYRKAFYSFLQQRNFNFKNSFKVELQQIEHFKFLVYSLRLIHINQYFSLRQFKSFNPSQISTLVDDSKIWFEYIKSIEPKIILN